MDKQNVIRLLSDLVAIDSRSSKSNVPIIQLLRQWFEGYECTVQQWVQSVFSTQGENLIVRIPGENHERSLVFVGHMDTVPSNESWETDPFTLEEQNGRFYGLGTCDTKGGVAALLAAVFSLEKKPPQDIYLVFNGDEESGSAGARKMIKTFSFPDPSFIFLEPTDMQVLLGQRTFLPVNITTYGKAWHSSQATPKNNLERNAIFKMSRILETLTADAVEMAKEADPIFGSNTQNFGTITGGTARNVFAENCTILLERRLLPYRDPQKEIAHIKKLVGSIDQTARVEVGGIGHGFATPQDSVFAEQILAKLKTVTKEGKFGVFDAWSEAGLFGGIGEVLILGPGSLKGQAHQANEYVEAKELFSYVHVFRKIIEEVRLL